MTAQEAAQFKHTGEGWDRELVKPFLAVVSAAVSPIDILQIKEKFATLTIYATGPDWLQELVDVFEEASLRCCEDCGVWHNQYSRDYAHYAVVETKALPSGYWLKTLCTDCRAKRQQEYDADVANRSLKSKGDVV